MFSLLPFFAALTCAGLAGFSLWRDRRSVGHLAFTAGMGLLALQQLITGVASLSTTGEEVLQWRHWRTLTSALVPGSWLVFSLSFGRANYREHLSRWKWVIVSSFAIPLALMVPFADTFFRGAPVLEETGWFVRTGWAGWAFHIVFLLAAVSVVVNLEATLRELRGSLRWKNKFMLLGIGCIFAVQVYTASQAILFSGVNTELDFLEAAALVVAAVLMMISFVRAPTFNVDLYVSQKVLYHSLTAMVVGVYLVAVGVLGKLGNYAGGNHGLVIASFVVFAALVGLVMFLLADELRQKFKRFIIQNFRRPRYDYRREWMRFTERTVAVFEIDQLSASVAAMLSETFGVASVSVLLLDESRERMTLGGSTVFPSSNPRAFELKDQRDRVFLQLLCDQRLPVDIEEDRSQAVIDFKNSQADFLAAGQARYCAPLLAGGKLIGLLTLSERIDKESFSLEDMDLLKTVADQTAANLSSLTLARELVQAKELEAFQNVSAFFVHDLKNLASTLSMTLKNLPVHFDNPEFRKDALRGLAQSVETINSVCTNISLVNKRLELQRTTVDMNKLVTDMLARLNGSIQAPLSLDCGALPSVSLDAEQMQKVLLNLLLNANEAAGPGGKIHVSTGRTNGWITVSVKDNGCGMSEEFMASSLFKPFRSSKKRGMGIGLFHSKKIVESHHGQIEVKSELGKGSTFMVMLPVGGGRG